MTPENFQDKLMKLNTLKNGKVWVRGPEATQRRIRGVRSVRFLFLFASLFQLSGRRKDEQSNRRYGTSLTAKLHKKNMEKRKGLLLGPITNYTRKSFWRFNISHLTSLNLKTFFHYLQKHL